MDGERTAIELEFRDVKDGAPMSADQIKKFIARMDMVIGDEDAIKKAKGVRGWLDAQVKDKARVALLRSRLIAIGVSEERLRRFPVEQVILLDEKCELEIRRDERHEEPDPPLMAGRGDGEQGSGEAEARIAG